MTNDDYEIKIKAIDDEIVKLKHLIASNTKEISNLINPNLLINANFQINQRNCYSDNTSARYMADRWYKNATSTCLIEFNKNKCKITNLHNSTSTYNRLLQKIECTEDLKGKTLTASVNVTDIYNQSGVKNKFGLVLSFFNSNNTQIAFNEVQILNLEKALLN